MDIFQSIDLINLNQKHQSFKYEKSSPLFLKTRMKRNVIKNDKCYAK